MLTGTDFVAIVPGQLAAGMVGPFGLEYRPMPEISPPFRFGFAWSPVQDRDPAHSWLRAAIVAHMPKLVRVER